MMRKGLAWMILLAGCGGSPVLSGLPRPNKTAAAGIAVGAAAAATIADPQGAARLKEAGKQPNEKRPIEVQETIPQDVFDKMDQADAASDGDDDPRP
jgi:hypothetical protein